jgi:signal transduction histidine kinase
VHVELREELQEVRAPEKALREAATNLIDNALKYCGPANSLPLERRLVSIGCGLADTEEGGVSDEAVCIEVWNSGGEISRADLLRAMEWGERGSAASAMGVDGSGFGLPIAAQLVALLGGELRFENARMPLWAWQRERDLQREEAVAAARGEDLQRPSGVSARILLPRAQGSE